VEVLRIEGVVVEVGPGESGRWAALSFISWERLSPPAVRDALQISQVVREGWFSNVQREQVMLLPFLGG
jgi:hypothetical protein